MIRVVVDQTLVLLMQLVGVGVGRPGMGKKCAIPNLISN
jgi:hypothetical protein